MPALRNDKRVFDFSQAVRHIAELRGVSALNPVVVRLTNPAVAALIIVVAALEEPATQILPLNVLWLNMNATSPTFMRLMVRTEKGTGTGGLTHKWAAIALFSEVTAVQTYDAEDRTRIEAGILVSPASTSRLGIARLSCNAVALNSPIVVGDNDPRLTDARTPLPHTHPLPPITSIKTATGEVLIDQTVTPEEGMVLYATSAATAQWKFLAHSDIIEG
jgi:hypothetical protein